MCCCFIVIRSVAPMVTLGVNRVTLGYCHVRDRCYLFEDKYWRNIKRIDIETMKEEIDLHVLHVVIFT